MANNGANKSKPSLDGMVFCANCGSGMANTGLRYYCPNTTLESGGNCPTRPVNADSLVHGVITRMVNRLATGETVRSITESIMDATEASARTQRSRMEQAEAAIAETNARRPAVLLPVEHGAKTYDEVADEISQLDQITAGLAFESMVARNELDKIEFIRDEDSIREAANNPETYLGDNSHDETQELLELLIQKVAVDSGAALVLYEAPLPSAAHPEGTRQDLLFLDPGRPALTGRRQARNRNKEAALKPERGSSRSSTAPLRPKNRLSRMLNRPAPRHNHRTPNPQPRETHQLQCRPPRTTHASWQREASRPTDPRLSPPVRNP